MKRAKRTVPANVALARWLLEHLAGGPYTEAISGDLMEGLRRGYSAGWYWQQTLWAIWVGFGAKTRRQVEPLLFSVVWSMLYPVWWLIIERNSLLEALARRWVVLDWPYSSSLRIMNEIAPTVAFVWLGFFVYLMLHPRRLYRLSRLRLFCGLSMSMNVILIAAAALLDRRTYFQLNMRCVSFSDSHFLYASALLTVSCFSVILTALASWRDDPFPSERMQSNRED